jgi:hypothetical protein
MIFRTRYGIYKYKILLFGLYNRPATYQQYMNNILFEYLDVFCTVYLDDIIIYSDTKEKHELYIRKVLQKFISVSLQVDIKKYEFKV